MCRWRICLLLPAPCEPHRCCGCTPYYRRYPRPYAHRYTGTHIRASEGVRGKSKQRTNEQTKGREITSNNGTKEEEKKIDTTIIHRAPRPPVDTPSPCIFNAFSKKGIFLHDAMPYHYCRHEFAFVACCVYVRLCFCVLSRSQTNFRFRGGLDKSNYVTFNRPLMISKSVLIYSTKHKKRSRNCIRCSPKNELLNARYRVVVMQRAALFKSSRRTTTEKIVIQRWRERI